MTKETKKWKGEKNFNSRCIILAQVDEAGVIARNNEIPWKCTAAARLFYKYCKSKNVIIGRNSFCSKEFDHWDWYSRALYIIDQYDYKEKDSKSTIVKKGGKWSWQLRKWTEQYDGYTESSVENAVRDIRTEYEWRERTYMGRDICVVGGVTTFEQAIPYAYNIVIARIPGDHSINTNSIFGVAEHFNQSVHYFPKLDPKKWELKETKDLPVTENDSVERCTIEVWQKKGLNLMVREEIQKELDHQKWELSRTKEDLDMYWNNLDHKNFQYYANSSERVVERMEEIKRLTNMLDWKSKDFSFM